MKKSRKKFMKNLKSLKKRKLFCRFKNLRAFSQAFLYILDLKN